MQLSFQPLDTLFFRDGKPFARGDETWADSTFPPSPSVLYGALRTALATLPGKEIPFSEVADQLGADKLAIQHIYYSIANTQYLPLPLDLVSYASEASGNYNMKSGYPVHLLCLSKRASIVSAEKSFINYMLHAKDFQIAENIVGGLLSANELRKYLAGDLERAHAQKLSDYVQAEPKIGIGRNNLFKSAEDGLLYRVDMKRLKGIEMRLGIRTDFTAEALDKRVVPLGGETKLCRFQVVESSSGYLNNPPQLRRGSFKIYLSTPAFFTQHGWQPDLSRFGINARLIAATIGKPLHIGGFDLLLNKPKPMLKAVPAGSVYYYETEEVADRIIEKLHHKSLSDYLPEQGYGIAFVGNTQLTHQ